MYFIFIIYIFVGCFYYFLSLLKLLQLRWLVVICLNIKVPAVFLTETNSLEIYNISYLTFCWRLVFTCWIIQVTTGYMCLLVIYLAFFLWNVGLHSLLLIVYVVLRTRVTWWVILGNSGDLHLSGEYSFITERTNTCSYTSTAHFQFAPAVTSVKILLHFN